MKHNLQHFSNFNKSCGECDGRWPRKNWFRRGSFCFNTGIHLQGERFCSLPCLEPHLQREVQRLALIAGVPLFLAPRVPLGLALLERGVIDERQLRHALDLQKQTGRRLGVILRETAGVEEQEVALAVARQWAVPFVELPAVATGPPAARLLPSSLSRHYGVLVVHADTATKRAYLAFADRVQHSILHALEHITGYTVEPCIAREGLIASAVAENSPNEVALDQPLSVKEAVAMIGSYAINTESHSIRLARCAEHLWAQLRGPRDWHLLLRLAGV